MRGTKNPGLCLLLAAVTIEGCGYIAPPAGKIILESRDSDAARMIGKALEAGKYVTPDFYITLAKDYLHR